MNYRQLVTAVGIVSLFYFGLAGFGAESVCLHVSPDGNDAADGNSSACAFRTVERARDVARGHGGNARIVVADGFSGKLHACEEGVLAWKKREEILSLPLWEGDKVFLRLLAEEHPFFSLKLRYRGDVLVEAVLDGKPLSV